VSGDDLVKIFGMLWKLIAALAFLASAYAGALYAGQIKLDDEKLDKEVFVEYRVSDRREREEDRRENRNEHDKLFGYVVEINKGMQKLNTNVEILINERDRQ
jgi:serine phosphatase RsbU (regulator of sigma subunit)